MKRYRYLLFDLDGTLTDSAPGIINCVRYAMDSMELEMPDRPERFLGPPLHDSFAEFCGLAPEQITEAVGLYRERYRDTGLFENSVYDGVPEMLERLKNGGKELFVATSKPEVFAERILKKFGLADYFRVIGGADINGSRNEKWEVIKYVLQRTGIADRSGVLMIGDRKHDVIGAKKCGIPCMGVLWGYGSAEELSSAGADYFAETPHQAADFLLS